MRTAPQKKHPDQDQAEAIAPSVEHARTVDALGCASKGDASAGRAAGSLWAWEGREDRLLPVLSSLVQRLSLALQRTRGLLQQSKEQTRLLTRLFKCKDTHFSSDVQTMKTTGTNICVEYAGELIGDGRGTQKEGEKKVDDSVMLAKEAQMGLDVLVSLQAFLRQYRASIKVHFRV